MKKLHKFWPALFLRYLALWRARWAAKTRKDRVILAGKLIGLLAAFWLAFWYVLGPSSVDVGDIQVDLDRSLSLAGPDQDKNGIRDDVDRYIEALAKKKGYGEPQVKAIQQASRSLQGLVTVDLTNPKAIDRAHNKDTNSVRCLFYQFSPEEVNDLVDQTQKIIVNTKARTMAFLKYNHTQDGTVTTLPEGNTCEP